MTLYPNISLPLAELKYGRQNWSLVVLVAEPTENLSEKGTLYIFTCSHFKLFFELNFYDIECD